MARASSRSSARGSRDASDEVVGRPRPRASARSRDGEARGGGARDLLEAREAPRREQKDGVQDQRAAPSTESGGGAARVGDVARDSKARPRLRGRGERLAHRCWLLLLEHEEARAELTPASRAGAARRDGGGCDLVEAHAHAHSPGDRPRGRAPGRSSGAAGGYARRPRSSPFEEREELQGDGGRPARERHSTTASWRWRTRRPLEVAQVRTPAARSL